jgi:predicted ABC-type ATPase
MAEAAPRAIIIAGPNGAGKTTFAGRAYLAHDPRVEGIRVHG